LTHVKSGFTFCVPDSSLLQMYFEIDIVRIVLTFLSKSSLREKVARGFVPMFSGRRRRKGRFGWSATRIHHPLVSNEGNT